MARVAYFSCMKHWVAYVIFVACLVVGLLTYKSYGLSWDDGAQHDIGEMTYFYIAKGDTALFTFKDKDYGVAFELPVVAMEQLWGLTSGHDVFTFRHLMVHLFFLLSSLFIYFFVIRLYNKKWLALAVMFLYIFQPVIYAHSFFNSKDIPMLAMFVICFWALLFFHQRQSILRLLLLALTTAFLLNLRLSGLFFIAMVGLYFFIQFFNKENITNNETISRGKTLLHFSLYLVAAFLLLWGTWPHLWHAPFHKLALAVQAMTHFRWGDNLLLFGHIINSTNLPFYYIPAWIILNNSVVIMLACMASFIFIPIIFIKKMKQLNTISLFNMLVWTLVIGTLCSIFILRPVLYDSWRQFFYLAPFLLLCATSFFYYLLKIKKAQWIVWSLLIYVSVHYAVSVATLFPYSHMYFTEWENKSKLNHLRTHYEMDYWGTVYAEAHKYILANDHRKKVPIKVNTTSGTMARYILPPEDEKRVIVSYTEGDYFITCFRYHPNGHPEYDGKKILFEIKRYNNIICRVYDLRADSSETPK